MEGTEVTLCYIQARGGSKRFPGKNLADWNGKPLLVDAIEKAKATRLFDVVAVTSDDTHILRIAAAAGALPILRSIEAATDTATDDDVAYDTLRHFNRLDMVCKLYPCVPLLRTEELMMAYAYACKCCGVHGIDGDGKDAGAFYVFRFSDYKKHGTISLVGFPWVKMVLTNAIDINYPEDLEKARRIASE